jgi:thioredoxin reductase
MLATRCKLNLQNNVEEGFIKINNKQETTVAKVYAAGDVDTDRHYVVLAVASGAVAAISIYQDILKKALENNIRIE